VRPRRRRGRRTARREAYVGDVLWKASGTAAWLGEAMGTAARLGKATGTAARLGEASARGAAGGLGDGGDGEVLANRNNRRRVLRRGPPSRSKIR
jgi:hypothetical protein